MQSSSSLYCTLVLGVFLGLFHLILAHPPSSPHSLDYWDTAVPSQDDQYQDNTEAADPQQDNALHIQDYTNVQLKLLKVLWELRNIITEQQKEESEAADSASLKESKRNRWGAFLDLSEVKTCCRNGNRNCCATLGRPVHHGRCCYTPHAHLHHYHILVYVVTSRQH
ncbi:uncharacterized protein LOC106164833 isoform X1 [Lingula anatina]|uniref:Uncharacterized protein LOC106164833 isoform X1 n=1 Tax=Lingula anatina TaxID=7574 RepID=A0A1S3IKA4_LINAN|nr:uncharacterized protein LOC106164833 isoform X1 [Lingula anatina]|eukprot:XP_013398316.1 uncharacterized protein LOC106164833 isoform X1 [Lingula anatina]